MEHGPASAVVREAERSGREAHDASHGALRPRWLNAPLQYLALPFFFEPEADFFFEAEAEAEADFFFFLEPEAEAEAEPEPDFFFFFLEADAEAEPEPELFDLGLSDLATMSYLNVAYSVSTGCVLRTR